VKPRHWFQCLNRHEQPSSYLSPGPVLPPPASFNASIGTSNLQASVAHADAHADSQFQCLNRHEQPSSGTRRHPALPCGVVSMPQSARATFKPMLSTTLVLRSTSFNASIGTSNLQARYSAPSGITVWGLFQCLNRHEQPSSECRRLFLSDCARVSMPQSARATFKRPSPTPTLTPTASFNASIGTSNLQAFFGAGHQYNPIAVSMPQSARATFKPRALSPRLGPRLRFNASIGTSNLQAGKAIRRLKQIDRFQCLNRHEQPSSPALSAIWLSCCAFQCLNRHEQPSSSSASSSLSKKASRFNASIGTSNLQASIRDTADALKSSFNASIGTSNLQAQVDPVGMCRVKVSMPQSARATFKPEVPVCPDKQGRSSFNASIGTSNLQALTIAR